MAGREIALNSSSRRRTGRSVVSSSRTTMRTAHDADDSDEDSADEDNTPLIVGSRSAARRREYSAESSSTAGAYCRAAIVFAGGLVAGGMTIAFSRRASATPPPLHSGAAIGTGFAQKAATPAGGRTSQQEEQPKHTLHMTAQSKAEPDAYTRGPYYGDLEQAGEFDRCVRTVSWRGELVLLHGDGNRLRMIINLIANLNELNIDHVLLLGFGASTCARLSPRRRIGCAHSSFLWDGTAEGEAAELAARRAKWTLEPKYVAWIQKFHYMRRLIERRINVLALDSDVVVTVNPYPHLHGPFGRFALLTAFDTKGGFANINVGVVYVQNASVGGPVHGLFVEFERRVVLALRMTPPAKLSRRAYLAPRLFWCALSSRHASPLALAPAPTPSPAPSHCARFAPRPLARAAQGPKPLQQGAPLQLGEACRLPP